MPVLDNPRHEIIAQELASGKTAEKAIIAAGYRPTSAAKNPHKFTGSYGIPARVAELLTDLENSKLVTARSLHIRWSEMFEADWADCIDEATGKLKPVHQWPKIWRQMCSGLDIKELFERSKDGGDSSWDQVGEVIKMKWLSAKDLGDMLGRHKAVDAFVKQQGDVHLHAHLHAEVTDKLNAALARYEKVIEIESKVVDK